MDERRHGDVLHMPFATSLRHLRELIQARLKAKFPNQCPPIPCLEWIRLQFWPANKYTLRALKYTGQFRVKFGIQVRQLHKDHIDSHYVSALLKYARAFAVVFRDCCQYISVDDKAIIPVGYPDCPVSTGVRGHNRSLVAIDADSFTFVTSKDNVTQPSSALRHASEMADIIRTHYSTNSSAATKPVMIIVSDHGS